MGLSDDDQLFKKHCELCNKLSLEHHITTESWDMFQLISKNFSLEGEALNWLGCAVFVACTAAETPTVGNSVLKGNCVNVCSLLRHSNLSFAQFFCNMEKWIDMAKLSDDYRNRIKLLNDTFVVAYNTFEEYYPLFQKIFMTLDPQEMDQSRQHRNRKQKPVACTSYKVFEFIWNLFITIKGEEPTYNTDVIKSYHLLYACIDLAFKNAYFSDRRQQLLNPNFEALPPNFGSPGFEPVEAPCLIRMLCKLESSFTDAMHIKTYILKKYVTNYFKDETFIGNKDDFTGIFESSVFENNLKKLTAVYQMQLLNKGGFDEKIFLAERRRKILENHIQTQGRTGVNFNESGDISTLDSPRTYGMLPAGSQTPLTGRRYLGPREVDSVSTDTQNIAKLNNMISGRTAAPSENLLELFESCDINPKDKIDEIVRELGTVFLNSYPVNGQLSEIEEGSSRLQYGTTLFYKYIEIILQNEKTLRNDISALVQNELFYQTIFACLLEIVMFSYNSQRVFPWIAETLNIQPYHFIKVIELIVRSKDLLSRDIIKHLSRIEESVLESLTWKSNGYIWPILNSLPEIPKFKETARPDQMIFGHNLSSGARKAHNDSENLLKSPKPSASEVFQSPHNSNVNRQLFPNVQAGQSLLQQKHTHLMITDKDGNRKLIPIIDQEKSIAREENHRENAEQNSAVSDTPRRKGSVAIFFRKFYNLAGARLDHLCTKLKLNDTDLKFKIWTIFEESITNHIDLIKDRHLDQLLMCAVYVICKVCGISGKFTEIMKCYRDQPQADSEIYRNVLITPKKTEVVDGVSRETLEKRGDLISFYNTVYVNLMKNAAQKFANSNMSNLILSPLPATRRSLVSPVVQIVGNVFVKPLDTSCVNMFPSKHYFFNRSPSKDLKDINRAINSNGVSGKRLLVDGDLSNPASKRISNRKIQSLVEERKSQNTE